MIREVAHFFGHVPRLIRLRRGKTQAEFYDILMERSERVALGERRARLVGDLRGEVLEVGSGTGFMFAHYPSDVRLAAIEPSDGFMRNAGATARAARADVRLVAAAGESLPFDDGTFDAAVIAWTLCSVSSVEGTLAEVRRVLRPGGHLRLIEHVISDDAFSAALMHLLNRAWLVLNRQGCNMNRSAERALRESGFRLLEVERFRDFVPGLPAFPSRMIRAVRPGR